MPRRLARKWRLADEASLPHRPPDYSISRSTWRCGTGVSVPFVVAVSPPWPYTAPASRRASSPRARHPGPHKQTLTSSADELDATDKRSPCGSGRQLGGGCDLCLSLGGPEQQGPVWPSPTMGRLLPDQRNNNTGRGSSGTAPSDWRTSGTPSSLLRRKISFPHPTPRHGTSSQRPTASADNRAVQAPTASPNPSATAKTARPDPETERNRPRPRRPPSAAARRASTALLHIAGTEAPRS